jgi:hypothetical protein
MEKLKFGIRCLVILLAFPVVMYADLTREDSVNTKPKQVHEAKVSEKTSDNSELGCVFSVMQAVYN